VLVPPAPGVLCAEGLLAADLKAEFHRTLSAAGRPDDAEARAILSGLQDEAQGWLADELVAPADRSTEEVALMRYAGQGGELAVPWGGSAAAAQAAFCDAHQALYGFTMDAPVELVTLRVEAVGRLPAPVMATLQAGAMPAPTGQREVHFAGGSQATPIYARADLAAGTDFAGPAIITQLDATTLVPPGWNVEVHASASLLLRRV
jgi:N-methylhydantoinase A